MQSPLTEVGWDVPGAVVGLGTGLQVQDLDDLDPVDFDDLCDLDMKEVGKVCVRYDLGVEGKEETHVNFY